MSGNWTEVASAILISRYPEGVTTGVLAARVEERVPQGPPRQELLAWLRACERDGTVDHLSFRTWRAGQVLMEAHLRHNHMTRDVKPKGQCPGCDAGRNPPGGRGEETPQVISDLISLVAEAVIPPEVIATWTLAERAAAVDWAACEHLAASDNQGVKVPVKPDVVERAEAVCSGPVQAQLAVEAWAGRNSEADFMMNPVMLARLAQDAITGLIALRGARG